MKETLFPTVRGTLECGDLLPLSRGDLSPSTSMMCSALTGHRALNGPFPGDKSPGAKRRQVGALQKPCWLLPLLSAASLIALAGCGRSPAPDPTVLATVGDRVIRVEDMQREIAWRQSARRGVPEPRALLEEM